MTWTEELEGELRSHYHDYREMDDRPEGTVAIDYCRCGGGIMVASC